MPMFNRQSIVSYLFHQFKAQNRHGLHSPFVYRLVDEVIYDFSSKADYQELKQLRSARPDELAKMNRSVTGWAGKCGPLRLARLIYRLASHFNPQRIIELGTVLGAEAAYIRKAVPGVEIFGMGDNIAHEMELIDWVSVGCIDDQEIAKKHLNQCIPKLGETSVILFNTKYRNQEIKMTWEWIKEHPQVTVTIDLFWLGLAFVRPKQAREHFNIRYW